MSSQLLTGVRVLDLTNVLAGPFAGYQLALLDADAALNRRGMGTSFLAQNAGKRSLNLKSEDGKAIFRRLVASADVVLENFRSGVMSVTGDAHSAPLRVGYSMCDTISGITAAFAISSAIVRPHPAGARRPDHGGAAARVRLRVRRQG